MQQIPVHQHNPKQVNGTIYVRLTRGFFQNLRRLISGSLILMFFATAWINLDGEQIVLFDFYGRRIHLFGLKLSPQDLFLLAGFMIIGAVSLFAMAMAYSRIWCGFACPQSIWTWIFIRIETLVEGSRNNRIKRDKQRLKAANLTRRIVKHALWLLVAAATSITFIGYFVPVREIASDIIGLNISLEMFSWILIFTLLTYVNAGLTREKVCLHMCPYARFQSVMFDEDTRTVSYDQTRGEPRTNSVKTGSAKKISGGDCVDCKLCVHVCPTGIDIRDGLQADCIACGACIDVCDEVMDKLSKPRGLIRFISANTEQNKPSPVLRPRLVGYLVAILATFGYLVWEFNDRDQLLIEVLRDRQNIYRITGEGQICNDYLLIAENLSLDSTGFTVAISHEGGQNERFELEGPGYLKLTQGKRNEFNYRVCAKQRDNAIEIEPRSNSEAMQFVLSADGQFWQQQSSFIFPPQF
ncbi:cytochrome c oxidase accessory protein CcoG [Amphritea sp. HPY]|uniref:cytochrome c oxidase accessory protein CcoG n=1 Tax=Amphritea sp. HPY TaxID=3421652 RepID=UPI003D7D254C